MMKAKISEIFSSVQGEGTYVGTRQVFVRFYECNMHCVWCDTPYAIGDVPGRFKEYSPHDLLSHVVELQDGCHSVSLTGGEPLLHKDFLKEFLPLVRKTGLKTYLETNGTLPRELDEIIGYIDIIAMDVKLPSSTKCRTYWQEHEEFLRIALQKETFVKVVVSEDTSREDIACSVELVSKINRDIIFILQPNSFELKNGVIGECLRFHQYCSKRLTNVRVLPQVHKYMRLR